jgi:hypothetical protein
MNSTVILRIDIKEISLLKTGQGKFKQDCRNQKWTNKDNGLKLGMFTLENPLFS